MNKKRFALTTISILLIIPISFIFANMSEAALTYSVRRGDVLIGAFVVLVCILIRFGLDREIVRLLEEEQEREAKEKENEEENDSITEIQSNKKQNKEIIESEELIEGSEENSYSENDLELEADSDEDIDGYDEQGGSIIGSLFKNIIIYVIAATLLVVILFFYSIEWISLVLALTGITFISIVLLEKNIYGKRNAVERIEEADDLDNLYDELDDESDDKLVGHFDDKSENETNLNDVEKNEKANDVNKSDNTDEVIASEKTDVLTRNTETTESSEKKEEAEAVENTENKDNKEEIAGKGKKKKRNRKRNKNVADRIKSIQAEEKVVNEDNGIELTFVETKIDDSSDEPSKAEPAKEDKNEKEKNEPTKADNKKAGLEFISVGDNKDNKENNKVTEKSGNVEKEEKKVEPDKTENIKAELGSEIKKIIKKEIETNKEEDIENNDTVEAELDSEDTEVIDKKELPVGKIVFTAIVQTIAYLLPLILVILVFGDLQAKRFSGLYFMLIIILSILAAGIEVAVSNMPGNKVAYIITSIFLTLFLCHRSILIGLVFLLAAYLILVIVPISYDNWGTGGTKAVNRAKISMSRLVSRVFTLVMIVLAVWELSYGAMWEIDYLVIISVAVCSIGYLADRHY